MKENLPSPTGALIANRIASAAAPSRFPPDIAPDAGRLNLNEPAYPPSPRVIEAICAFSSDVGRYPDARCTALCAALAAALDVETARIICGNGSDELLALAGRTFLEPQIEWIIPRPGFPRYALMGAHADAKTVAVPVRADGACDIDAMLAACTPATRMLLVATPNNPTGQMLDFAAMTRLAHEVPAQTLLVVDEAYFEFGREAGGCDALQVLRGRDGHWLLLRTFSKAYALAGLRGGYGIASGAPVIESLHRMRETFNVNGMGQVAALAALQDQAYMLEQVAQCAAERDRMANRLQVGGFDCLPSAANFIAIDCGRAASEVAAALVGQRLHVGLLGPSHPQHIRVTIGTREQNDRLLNALLTS